LRPETQDIALFVEGVTAICEAQRTVALNYFEDGSVEDACPPIKALLHIMAFGTYEGRGIGDPVIRGMFSRESMLASDWYKGRLHAKQVHDIALWTRHVQATKSERARKRLDEVMSSEYLRCLEGTIGADPALV
jgi:phosphoenolpyruvate carboxykinase (diphosphate)